MKKQVIIQILMIFVNKLSTNHYRFFIGEINETEYNALNDLARQGGILYLTETFKLTEKREIIENNFNDLKTYWASEYTHSFTKEQWLVYQNLMKNKIYEISEIINNL